MDEAGVNQSRNKNGKDTRKDGELIFLMFKDAADGEKL
jgi:hypothetical protein